LILIGDGKSQTREQTSTDLGLPMRFSLTHWQKSSLRMASAFGLRIPTKILTHQFGMSSKSLSTRARGGEGWDGMAVNMVHVRQQAA